MPKVFSGKTPEQSVILGAWFFEDRITPITGRVTGTFNTGKEGGICTSLTLAEPVTIPANRMRPIQAEPGEVTNVAIGGLSGFRSAVEGIAGLNGLQIGDIVTIACVGKKDTGQASPMLEFSVSVSRP